MATYLNCPAAAEFLGNEALLRVVLASFAQSAPEQLQLFRQAITRGDVEQVRRYLHRLGPTLKIIATDPLNALIDDVHGYWRSATQISPERTLQANQLADQVAVLIAEVAAQVTDAE